MKTFEELKEALNNKDVDLQFKKENTIHIDATKSSGYLYSLSDFVKLASEIEKIAQLNKTNIVSISLLNPEKTSFFKNNDFYSVSTSKSTLDIYDVLSGQRLAYDGVPVKLIDNHFGFALELDYKEQKGGELKVVRFDNASARKNPISNEEYLKDIAREVNWNVKFVDTRKNNINETQKNNKKSFVR